MVKLVTPKNLNNKEKELLREFAGLNETKGHQSLCSRIFIGFVKGIALIFYTMTF